MRILLINPRSKALDALPIPPLGILYLAAYVRERGFKNVKVIDDNRERLPLEILEDEISKADVLGLTGTTSQYPNALKLAELARKYGVKIVYGGSHASTIRENGHFDYIVKGEGEEAFLSILEGKPATNTLIKNLDDLPFPARDLVPIREYATRGLKRFNGSYTHMMTGRGCNSKCIFCSSPSMWGSPRLMSAGRVFAEMLNIYESYGITNIHFQDDTFTLSRKRVLELCSLLKGSVIGFRWSCQTRPDMVDKHLLKEMSKAGCVQIEFGVESGDAGLLLTAHKRYDKKQIKEAFNMAREAGINTYGFFMVGLPGETILSWLKTVLFALSLKVDQSVWTVLMPFPGTRVYEEKMVEILDWDYANWLYKRPIIKVGYLRPWMLSGMRKIADMITNGVFNKGVYKTKKIKNES